MDLSSPWLRPQPRLSDALEAHYTKSRFVLARKTIKEHLVELEKTLSLNSEGREIWRLKNIKIYFTYIQTHVDHAISIRDKEVKALIEKKAQLEEENERLRVAYRCNIAQNEDLETQNETFETQNKQLETQNTHLDAWKQYLHAEKGRLENETSRLLQPNEHLKSYSQSILGANQGLGIELSHLQAQNLGLGQDNQRLKATNQQLLA